MRRKMLSFLAALLMMVSIPLKSSFACNLCIVIWCCCPYPCTSCACICCQFCMALEANKPLDFKETKAINTAKKRTDLADERDNDLEKKVSDYNTYLRKGVMGDNEEITGVPELSLLKSSVSSDSAFSATISGLKSSGSSIDLEDPLSVGSAVEGSFTTKISGTLDEVSHQMLMRQQTSQVDAISIFSRLAIIQKDLDNTRDQIDALVEQIDEAADLNTITKTNVLAKALLNKVLTQKNELEAIKQRRESFKKMLLNSNPSDAPVLQSLQ
ncbi:MAG: hypothetical protein AB7U85_03690 [Alphaproteobacteria bacterium]